MAKRKVGLREQLYEVLERASDTAAHEIVDWSSVELDLKSAIELVKEIKKQERGLYET